MAPYFDKHIQPDWNDSVQAMLKLLERGNSVFQMMQVTGEEGTTLDDFVVYQKATLVDMAYLQQDAFDPVDVTAPPERQQETFSLIKRLVENSYCFEDKEQARDYFTQQTGLLRNLNYSPRESRDYDRFLTMIQELERKHL